MEGVKPRTSVPLLWYISTFILTASDAAPALFLTKAARDIHCALPQYHHVRPSPHRRKPPAQPRVSMTDCLDRLLNDKQVRHRLSERALKTLDVVAKFVEEECIP